MAKDSGKEGMGPTPEAKGLEKEMAKKGAGKAPGKGSAKHKFPPKSTGRHSSRK